MTGNQYLNGIREMSEKESERERVMFFFLDEQRELPSLSLSHFLWYVCNTVVWQHCLSWDESGNTMYCREILGRVVKLLILKVYLGIILLFLNFRKFYSRDYLLLRHVHGMYKAKQHICKEGLRGGDFF